MVMKPFNKLIDIMKRIRMGDRSARFNIKRGSEISKIGDEFNMLIDEVVRSEERHKVISGISDSMLFDWNARTQRMYISDNLSEKFSISKELADERGILAFSECIHEDDFDNFYEDIQLAIQNENGIEGQYRFNLISGDYIWTSLKAMCITDWTGEPTHLIGVLHDIDADKRKELILSERATYDYLSQLYNRESFEKKLGAELDAAKKHQHSIAILFIDLDDFKDINDNYSHAVGDEVLKFVADTIKGKIMGKGFAGRFGGDEFVVCITNSECVENVEEFALRIIESLKLGFRSESGVYFNVACSIGIAISPDHGRAIPELFMAADDAMYHVKKGGKGNFHVYDRDKGNFSN
ncbi:MAG: diguanylate cyclase, partial [Clostridiales bacterium]|nr:diguanylate cyclase [Clostridiales bacterium]